MLKKVPRAKSGTFWFPEWIPMIQPPFCSSCVALQYETGTKVFHRAVPELCNIKNHEIPALPHGVSWRVCQIEPMVLQ